MNVMPEHTNTEELSKYLLQTIMDDPKVQESSDFFARTRMKIPFGLPIEESQEETYYALSAEYLMIALGKVIVLVGLPD